ncbi:hypothetical protein FS749_005932 [Ceratobasidium sp. UAMH 11750]|nr:hypothetical protein FS749_005932 [Ceratobasidium sp. UAMH 11750]
MATSPSDYQQLLNARMFPCSDERPSSAFTFTVLRTFHLAATDGKMSGGRFYALLSHLTTSTFPDSVPDRYREFMRVARQWMWLKTKQRAGDLHTNESQALALRCPACPRIGINFIDQDVDHSNRYQYTIHISYDGSFQLVRRLRTEDDHDICLTGDTMYFVGTESYEAYLSQVGDTGCKNTKVGDCNNHKAAIGAWTLYEGLAVTGVGACSCAHHAFYMPRGVVNYYKGERFAYTDYAIASVLKQLQGEGCDNVGVYYDIYCHWSRNWWTRAASLPSPITKPSYFMGGIPKYHLAGHTDPCYAQFSLNNMPGVGRLDAEGCERLWADANQASRSTSNKGSGARIDSLNYLFQDWNWRKTTYIASHLVRKLKEAVDASSEKRAQWDEFNACLDPSLSREWFNLDTKPYHDQNGQWTSVYLSTAPPAMSVTQSLKKLREMESTDNHTQDQSYEVFSAADWIAEGLQIELIQEKIRRDVKDYGSSPTPSQALDISRRRQALQDRQTRHSKDASLFYSPEQLAKYVLPQEPASPGTVRGKPETYKLALPSRLERLCKDLSLQNVPVQVNVERTLRQAYCLQALSRLRTGSQQKALLIRQKEKNVRGEVKNTRVQSMVTRLTNHVQLAAWEYRNSRSALLALGATADETARLKPLHDADLSGLTSMLLADRSTGEGLRQLPWFWAVRSMHVGEYDESREENDEAMRVEWFRGKARYERWEEEVMILRREMASVLFSFHEEVQYWALRMTTLEASFDAGFTSFCGQQLAMWQGLHKDAASKFQPFLQGDALRNETCRRAAELFL